MGEVYKAHGPTLQRTVAIKVLAKLDEDASSRLLQEARSASALNHPHICTIHEVGEHEGQAFSSALNARSCGCNCNRCRRHGSQRRWR